VIKQLLPELFTKCVIGDVTAPSSREGKRTPKIHMKDEGAT
jgi:hypothetical protein